jgi:hypothetical protein
LSFCVLEKNKCLKNIFLLFHGKKLAMQGSNFGYVCKVLLDFRKRLWPHCLEVGNRFISFAASAFISTLGSRLFRHMPELKENSPVHRSKANV